MSCIKYQVITHLAKNKPTSKTVGPSQHLTGGGFEIYGDSSTPGVLPNATGQIRNNPLDPSNNRENMKRMQKLKGTKVFFFVSFNLVLF